MAEQFALESKELDPESVLFNWECCSGCLVGQKDYTFTNASIILKLMQYIIDHKHMMMFSDFAVKALLNVWDEKILGPLPFA